MKLQIKRASMALLLSVICFAAYAQKSITGTVKDATGEPMIGVSVIVDGTTIGGVTDFEGNFSINNVPDNSVLKISYIGYKEQKVSVAGKNTINVTMEEDLAALDEVVVVGYGTMKKKDLTGAVGSVKADDIARVSGANALSAMQAKIPGIDLQQSGGGEAGAGVSMKLRGNRSLLASDGPLVIVDGVEYGTNIDLNASDIESMEVLKDASSTAQSVNTMRSVYGENKVVVAFNVFNISGSLQIVPSGLRLVQRLPSAISESMLRYWYLPVVENSILLAL